MVFGLLVGKLVLSPLEASAEAQYAVELWQTAPHWSLEQMEKAQQLDKTELTYLDQIALLADVVSKQQKDPKQAQDYVDLEIRAYEHATKIASEQMEFHYIYATTLTARYLDGRGAIGDRELHPSGAARPRCSSASPPIRSSWPERSRRRSCWVSWARPSSMRARRWWPIPATASSTFNSVIRRSRCGELRARGRSARACALREKLR